MIKAASLGALLLVVSTSSLTAQSGRKSWEWSLDARIAARTNAELARERVRDRREPIRTSGTTSAKERVTIVDSFNGKTHPELFLPHEVFDQLIKMGFGSHTRSGEVMRRALQADIQRHGFPDDFWQRLEVHAVVYIADLAALSDLGRSLPREKGPERQRILQATALKNRDVCRSRAVALAAARNEFGRARFDRFLYEVIAVNMFIASDRLPAPEVLRNAEEGCR